jgi:hypothetical protein
MGDNDRPKLLRRRCTTRRCRHEGVCAARRCANGSRQFGLDTRPCILHHGIHAPVTVRNNTPRGTVNNREARRGSLNFRTAPETPCASRPCSYVGYEPPRRRIPFRTLDWAISPRRGSACQVPGAGLRKQFGHLLQPILRKNQGSWQRALLAPSPRRRDR